MDILYLLIPLSVVLAFAVGAAFWWALESGQFEDLDGPAHRILTDADPGPDSCASPAARHSSALELNQDPREGACALSKGGRA